jgi:hypothetical protein
MQQNYPKNILNLVDALYHITIKNPDQIQVDEIKEQIAFHLEMLINDIVEKAVMKAMDRINQ